LKNIKYLLYIVAIITLSGHSYFVKSTDSAQIDLSAGQTWGVTRGGIQSNFDEVYSAIENTYIQDLLTGVISGSELQLSGADGDRRITLSPNTTFDATLKDPGTNRIIDLSGVPGYVDTSNVFHAFGSNDVSINDTSTSTSSVWSSSKTSSEIAGVSIAAPTIQTNDPTLADSTGWYLADTSGDAFYVVHGVKMYTLTGTMTADETAPVIVAGADSTHDGATAVTATMTLTELYPELGTLLFTATNATPASGSLTGTYPNYSISLTPANTSDIVVTYAASDLAGNAATGTDLVQTFAYASGSLYTTSFSDDFNRADNTNVITGSSWTSETDAAGIGSILNNEYSIAMDGTNSTRISKTISANNTDYEIKFKAKLADITGVDTQGVPKSSGPIQIYCASGLFLQIGFRTNVAGHVIETSIARYNDAGSVQSAVVTALTFVVDTYVDFTIQVDVGEAGTSDGIIYVLANSTPIMNLTGLADETRPIVTDIRFGLPLKDWNQANTLTIDDFTYGYK
jgi:hypothetical protein